jgi:hypothetical protein
VRTLETELETRWRDLIEEGADSAERESGGGRYNGGILAVFWILVYFSVHLVSVFRMAALGGWQRGIIAAHI